MPLVDLYVTVGSCPNPPSVWAMQSLISRASGIINKDGIILVLECTVTFTAKCKTCNNVHNYTCIVLNYVQSLFVSNMS